MLQCNNTVYKTSILHEVLQWAFHHQRLIMSNAALQ